MAEDEFVGISSSTQSLPITAICIVADKNKTPKSFVPITKCQDDQSDADLWRDGFFTLNRQVRYISVSTQIPDSTIKTPVHVVTNMIIVRETDPIPHGYVAIDYTADSREKSLRKKFICIRTEPRDRVVDAIGEIIILGKTKKVPKDYTSAGEVDSLLICYKVVPIPQTYGIQTSNSASNITKTKGLYPDLPVNSTSSPTNLDTTVNSNAFTLKNGIPRVKAIDGIDFQINSNFLKDRSDSTDLPDLSRYQIIEEIQSNNDLYYSFAVEKAVLS